MWNWLTKREPCETHVCQEFTQWTACVRYVRIAVTHDGKAMPEEECFDMAQNFQERRCTLCGKIFQERLQFDSYFDDDEDEPSP